MEYLRATISSQARGPLYKKDFEVQKVFNTFVRRHVNKLINAGELLPLEYYRALIIPGYGPYRHEKRTEEENTTEGATGHDWLALKVTDDAMPLEHMDFFTLEIHSEDRPYVLSENFLLSEIDYFWQSVERALVQFDIMSYQEERDRLLFACNDDKFDFDREELYTWQKEANELIEIVGGGEDPDTTATLLRKELKDFPILGAKKMQAGKLVEDIVEHHEQLKDPPSSGMQILIVSSALESLQQASRSDVQAEIGGFLVGDVYEDGQTPSGYLVEITGHIAAQNTVANEVELRTTFETWQQQTVLLKERYPGKRIVGWYHTHLDLVARPKIDKTLRILYTSPIFLSADDIFTHRQFFREKWYVAMVLDTRGDLIFYRWAGHKIVTAQKFYVTAPQEKEE
jgi:proteasome lid subunit RPN8/RPN11